MQSSPFGTALRQARLESGLTQADLGAPKFSRSYVSLLESGARQPTHDVIQHLAGKLGRPQAELELWDASRAEAEGIALAARQVESVLRLSMHSRAEARAVVRDLEHDASPDSPLGEMIKSLSVILSDSAVPAPDSLASLAELMNHRVAESSPGIYAYVVEQRCYLLRSVGRLREASELARSGLARLRAMDAKAACVAPVLLALIAALAELGATDEALQLRGELASELSGGLAPAVEGNGRWTLGNLAFMAGDWQAGVREHERASELIDPATHLRQWARLQRASAAMRLEYDVDLDAVPDLLSRAERAFSISADATDSWELDVVRARYWLTRGDAAQAWAILEPVVVAGHELAPQERAQACQLAGEALIELGRRPDAIDWFRTAADLYRSIHAYERAFSVCARWGFVPSPA